LRPSSALASHVVHEGTVCDGECGVRVRFCYAKECLTCFSAEPRLLDLFRVKPLLATALNASIVQTMTFAIRVSAKASIRARGIALRLSKDRRMLHGSCRKFAVH
jgi:hypothetical protein